VYKHRILRLASVGRRVVTGITERVSASKHPRSTLKIYDGSGHGVPMFPRNPDLRRPSSRGSQAVLVGGDRTH
jgi:hypothetical protein